MEKRLLLALLLMSGVILIQAVFFPPTAPAPRPAGDTTRVTVPVPARVLRPAPVANAPAQTVKVRSPLYEYSFSSRGGALTGAQMAKYPSYLRKGEPAQLVPRGVNDLLAHRLVVGRDTLDLRSVPFTPSVPGLTLSEGGKPAELRFTYPGNGGPGLELTYTFVPDDYRVRIRGRVLGAQAGSHLLTELGTGPATNEEISNISPADFDLVTGAADDVERFPVRKLEGATRFDGSFAWAALKDKYFVTALVKPDSAGITSIVARDVRDQRVQRPGGGKSVTVPRARVTTKLPLSADGTFELIAYVGPQEHGRLKAVGYDLDEVTPHGYQWLRYIVRPIAAVILWALNQMHDNWGISYGWVLVLFGVIMRVITWPLNSKAMRAQMKNMEKQPVLQRRMKEIQERYKEDPAGQQRAMLAMYKEEGVSPFSMLSGCIPMLIPFPVLITLFFVFQSAIEFRGTSFLWLPDLSLRDPYYILPAFLVLSMFALQYVSIKMSGAEENPQMKMMMYVMPLMMGAFFWAMPSGLNLYYSSTNVASLPQQLMIARERRIANAAAKAKAKAAEEAVRKKGPSGGASRSGPKRVKRR